MKKFILISCIILLTGISFLFALEEFSTEPISLDEFIEEYLPDYTIQKRIPLEGIGRAYAVAKDSGDIVAITEIGEQFKVHFFDIEGNLKWTKEFDKVKGVACEISNNGETIAIHFSNYLGTTNRIFSKEGELLFEKGFMDVWLIPSYDGQYLYERIMGENLIHPDFKLYSKDGSKVNIKGFDDTNVFNIRLKFMKPNKIFAYIEKKRDNELSDYFQLLEIEDQTV